MEFVTFEIAKKLKEKGFVGNGDIGCKCGFYTDAYNYAYDDLDNSELMPNECLRFTISQVLKWLREEKEIYINIQPIPTMATKNKICWGWDLKWDSDGVYIKQKFIDYVNYKTYEEAVLVGIEYVLDNLI